MCRLASSSLCFFTVSVSIVALVFPSIAKQSQPFFFSDSSRAYSVQPAKDLPQALLRDHVAKAANTKKALAVKNMLDSLGFFHARYDTLHDTIVVTPQSRSIVRWIRIKSGIALSIDSVENIRLPRPYDAGEIQAVAKKTLFVFGTKGYPFAALSIAFDDTADSVLKQGAVSGRGIGIIFDVRENGRYAFAKPLFIGTIKTSRRLLGHDIVYKEGQAFDMRKVEESRSRLLLRPYISSVEVSSPSVLLEPVMTPDSFSDSSQAARLDRVLVPFSCTDNSGLGFDGALSFQAGGQTPSNTFFGIVNLSLLNLLHSGEAARFPTTDRRTCRN